jgi:hypothetical protein
VNALDVLLGVRVTAADGERAAGADDVALCHERLAACWASKLTLNSTLSTSASAGIKVSAA